MTRQLVLCDIDGTLALRGDRAPHDHDTSMEDAVNWPIVKLCDALVASKQFKILLISGRDEKYRAVTEYWLNAHMILPYRLGLIMRYADDNRPDDVVKRELYEGFILTVYGPAAYVIDDRNKVVKMWREIGLTCLQVAEGDF